MKFSEVVTQTLAWLRREGRISYRALKLEFDLNDDVLDALKEELIEAKRSAVDENGKVLVWVGDSPVASSKFQVPSSNQSLTPNPQSPAERRQLTVLFCDLVGSTALSEHLDPEELREVVRAYQETCTTVIQRYDGHIAQHLGDGLLAYFGYPHAHEDDARRAVRTGLEIITALQSLRPVRVQVLSPLVGEATSSPSPWKGEGRGEGSVVTQSLDTPRPNLLPLGEKELRKLQVRIGIHTGLVVIGEIGSGEKREILALGETPNVAARIQGLAEPDSVVVSAATRRLVAGLFEYQDLGLQALKGISAPLSVYRVIRESAAQSRFEVAVSAGLTPLVGRDLEVGLLRERWTQAKGGEGQVILLSGEAGIGKSRLAQTLKEQILAEGATRIEFRCSPYHQNSAFYPIIEHLQRLLQFAREDTPQTKLTKLQHALMAYRFPQADTLSLVAALLSLPHPEGAPPLTLSPQKQKQKTQEALLAWIMEEAEKAAVYCAWEDLHWADPSTLEFLTLFLEQVPTVRLLAVLTFRPDFTPPWRPHSHIAQLTLNRLGRQPVEAMVEKITGDKPLPREVVQQIVAKTDGVPLFVEELTKTVLESIESIQSIESVIPTTLHDSLMARLDRLGTAKELAQFGATLGREFSYELLHAVSPLDAATLQQGLRQLVEAELLYQRGLPPQATYLFKHALVQDTAYQSLLKSKRQQLHQQIAQVLEQRFTETVETHPELLAHHYTEASLLTQAIPYWQQAGQRAAQRSANVEAIAHLTKELELLKTLPDTPERAQQELTLQTTLGPVLIATKGFAASEVEKTYTRARELCRQVGETPQLFQVLRGLWTFYNTRAEIRTAREIGEQFLSLAQGVQDSSLLVEAHRALGRTLFDCGELASARAHFEQGVALYDPVQHRSHAFLYGYDPGVAGLSFLALVLWHLGYLDQASEKIREALSLAQERNHPFSLAFALFLDSTLYQRRRDIQATQEKARVLITLSQEQGFPVFVAWGNRLQGWVLTEQGQVEEGITHMRQGMAAWRDTGTEMWRAHLLALLAEVYGKVGQAEEGLTALAEALAVVDKTGERFYEAELYRLRGELTLQSKTSLKQVSAKSQASQNKSEDTDLQSLVPDPQAEACFLKAIEIAQLQQAKSLELRAVMSLVRLRQQQVTDSASRTAHHAAHARLDEAHMVLSEIYNWFTEGFDTKDLQEAKALIEELSH